MPAVQSVQRFDQVLCVGTGTIGASQVAFSALTFTDQQGNALPYPSQTTLPWLQTNCVVNRLQPASGWRLTNTGTTTIYFGYTNVTTSVYQDDIPPGGFIQAAEGRSPIQSLVFLSSGAGGTIVLTVFSS